MSVPIISTSQKLACVQRELRIRQRVYPGRVERGRMSPSKAAHELRCMAAILEDLRATLEWEQSISPPLPGFFRDTVRL